MVDLSLHVHDDDRVGAITDDELFDVARQRMNAVYGDVGACKTSQRLEGVEALRTLDVPHLYRSVGTCTNMAQQQILMLIKNGQAKQIPQPKREKCTGLSTTTAGNNRLVIFIQIIARNNQHTIKSSPYSASQRDIWKGDRGMSGFKKYWLCWPQCITWTWNLTAVMALILLLCLQFRSNEIPNSFQLTDIVLQKGPSTWVV